MKPKRIIIDGRMWSWTGIGRITRNLIAELEQLDQTNHYTVLLQPADWDKWQPRNANFRKEKSDTHPYGLSNQFSFAFQLYQLRPDLVHFPHFTVPLIYRGPYVVTLNDLTLVNFKNLRGRGLKRLVYELKYWAMRLVLRQAILRAARVITISQFVRAELLKNYSRLKPDRITVIYPAADPINATPEPLDRLKLTGPFIFFVGNSYPHKNLERLITAFDTVGVSFPSLNLVLAGHEDYFYAQLRAKALKVQNIIMPGRVSDGELISLYKGAQAFVFPSLSEGFGLPALEAMTYGTPVIAADSSCLPEICAQAAVYFNPLDPRDIAAKITATLKDEKTLAALRAAGPQRAQEFSWKTMAEQTLELYKRAMR